MARVVYSSEAIKDVSGANKVVGELSKEDVATVVESWQHAIEREGLVWHETVALWETESGHYLIEVDEDSEDGFDILEYISENSEYELQDVMIVRPTLGKGRGLPPAAGSEPLTLGIEGVEYADEDQDDENTGILGDDDDFDDFTATGGYSGPVYMIEVERTGQTFPVGEHEVLIGRGKEGVDVQLLGNKGISRKHARFWVDLAGNLNVADLGSGNGTYVDAVALTGELEIGIDAVVSLSNERLRVSERR